MRIDYDQEARRYQAGREVPLEQIEPWRPVLGQFLRPGHEPPLDIGAGPGLWTRAFVAWFDAEVIALEPSAGMREMGAEIGVPAPASYVAASAEHLPFGRAVFRAAWLSTVVHHLSDLSACAGQLRRTLVEGAPVLIRNSFPGRLEVDASAQAGVSHVVCEVSGGPSDLSDQLIATATPTIYGWLAQWNTGSVPDGAYTLQSVASYAGGVSGSSAPVSSTISN